MEREKELCNNLYNNIVNHLEETRGYETTTENITETGMITQITNQGDQVGQILFETVMGSTGYKRHTEDSTQELSIHISYIEVNEGYQGQHISYYLLILALLYSKIHFPYIRKSVLDDCSDRSHDIIGNLYTKIGMTHIEHQQLLLPNEVEDSVPLSKKRRAEHICIRSSGKVGNIDVIIDKLKRLLRIENGHVARGGKKRKSRKTAKKRKTRTRKSRKY